MPEPVNQRQALQGVANRQTQFEGKAARRAMRAPSIVGGPWGCLVIAIHS
jgi:hypothetical protein